MLTLRNTMKKFGVVVGHELDIHITEKVYLEDLQGKADADAIVMQTLKEIDQRTENKNCST